MSWCIDELTDSPNEKVELFAVWVIGVVQGIHNIVTLL